MGSRLAELSRFGEDAFLDLNGRTPLRDEGDDSCSSASFVRVPRRAPLRGVVGVARLYDQSFDESETSLLEAVSASIPTRSTAIAWARSATASTSRRPSRARRRG